MKVYEFAKEIGIETIGLMDKIRAWKLPVKSHMASLSDEEMEDIKRRLKDEVTEGSTKKKKVVKKKAAKKKVAKKVAAKKKATTTIKKPSTVSRKDEEDDKEKAAPAGTKKKVTRKKSVIRRKAAHSPEALAKAKADMEAQEAEAALMASATESVSQIESSENVELSHGDTEGESSAGVVRRNIVGRMDLGRLAKGQQPSSAGGGPRGASRPSTPQPTRTGPGRNIRTGFIAPLPIHELVVPDDSERRNRDKEEKKKRAVSKEGPPQAFTATEFRKREVIFQPKKKRVLTGLSKQTQITTPKASKRIIKVVDSMSVGQLAQELNIKSPQLIKKLMTDGVMANLNTMLDFDTISLIVPEFGFEVQNVSISEEDLLQKAAYGELDAEPVNRPPVVTVMGHVDHGKTTLLDAIRNANVVSGEAGGITQHIGAYNVTLADGKVATFIDTPGHAAFTAMRARGANVTDVAIIVVAADDGMMPQTEEAISHAQAAGVPIIVAMNKMDKHGANPDRIKQQLSEKGLLPEDWGGETIYVPVSALKKEGVTELIETIHLVAEVLELKANPKRSGTGVIVESKMEKGKGNVATVLVQDGTIKVGDIFVAGSTTGRIRRMTNDRGEVVQSAEPGVPVEIAGLEDAPNAGDRFDVCKDEALAQQVAEVRAKLKDPSANPEEKPSIDDIFYKVTVVGLKDINVVRKADIAGSIEDIRGLFYKMGTEEVKIKVIHSAVGGISENDVLLAATSGGLVLGFNVRPDTAAQRLAKEKAVDIKTYNVIYNLSDDIKGFMSGLLTPDVVEQSLGSAEVRETFTVPKVGTIAGCFVVDGKIARNNLLRLVREGRVVYEGKVSSLKRFKDDVKEVQSGYECGIGIENFNDIKVGDVIEAFDTKEVARSLD